MWWWKNLVKIRFDRPRNMDYTWLTNVYLPWKYLANWRLTDLINFIHLLAFLKYSAIKLLKAIWLHHCARHHSSFNITIIIIHEQEQNLVELLHTDRLREEVIHASLQCFPFERRLTIGRAAADIGHLLLTQQNALLKESLYFCGYLRPIHLWHAVVEQDDLVHAGPATVDKFDTFL